MKRSAKQIKSIARENLLGKYPLPIAAALLYQIICSLLSLPFIRMIYQGVWGKSPSVPPVITGIIGLIIVILLAAIFQASILWLQIMIARREKISGKDLLYTFKNHPDKFAGLAFLLTVVLSACVLPGSCILGLTASHSSAGTVAAGILVLAVGIVIFIWLLLSWSMSVFYLMDNLYTITVPEALRKSFSVMKGKRAALLWMTVSFIGWGILGILSFGIGMLWVNQYYNQSVTLFYIGLTEEADQNRAVSQ